MGDKGSKTKIMIIAISIMVIALIVIGTILTWKIVQKGQENSLPIHEIEQFHIDTCTSEYACNQYVL